MRHPSLVLGFVTLVALGLILLAIAAEHFVIGASRIATLLRVSPVVIGAVVIGFGTSAPELLVSALAAGRGELDIAVGNIIGSSIANILLVLGVASLIRPIAVTSQTLRREAPLSALAVLLFAVVVQGGKGRLEGAMLLLALVLALGWILSRAAPDAELGREVREFLRADRLHRRGVEIARTLAGLVGTVAGAHLLIRGAIGIADELHLARGFLGLTLVAVGTSLPELVTAIVAARRGEHDLIAGNLLGSNLFNSLAVGGVVGIVGPGPVLDATLTGFATVVMLLAAAVAWFFMGTGRTVVRWEGALLLASYIALVPLVLH